MKNFAGVIVIFFIALFAYTKLAGPIPLSVTSVVTTKTDTFTVMGEGKATVIPDIAIVTVGVNAQSPTVKDVQQQLNTKMNAVIAAVKKTGVDAKDVQTTNYNISPVYDYQSRSQQITGYQASANLVVKVRDLDKSSEVIDNATAAGANQVGGVTFDISDKTKVESEARQKAVAEAKVKAEEGAKAAGFNLGRIINYSENFDGSVPRPMYAKAEMALDSSGGGAPTQIEPGSSEITVSVSLSYEIL